MSVSEPIELRSCAALADLPKPFHGEIAFAGRSNVGKSSLINALLGRRLAPISRTPGKTRTLRLYLWSPEKGAPICLVDLPGYGWARLPDRVRERWHPLVEGYLSQRPTLRGVVVVADLRRGCTEMDHAMAGWLRERDIPAVVIASKADKVPRGQRAALLQALADGTGVPRDDIIQFSAITGEGAKAAGKALQELARAASPR
ncbi:MAG: ribosome biogenesis GTP-binding protein YihA/YsxC [Candidatus Eisenbacteria bacterium]|jgi:GTP-binding protein|nr:ribosome biogenesis GTP-binding protein YihA/YsxC [Candidatus Eisenbacteria bacterium]